MRNLARRALQLALLTTVSIVGIQGQAACAESADGTRTAAVDSPPSEGGLEEIIVTANRRSERNQDVPIAITALSTLRLQQQNITQPQDLQGSVPSLSVSATGQISRDVQIFTLRGQGATFGASPGVVVYLNEVPLPAPITLSQQGGPGNFLDLENLQVLAGPQGTLFGRNTTGGAILLTPKKPTNEFGGYLQSTIGNYRDREIEGVMNIPVIPDVLMVRAVGSFKDRKGYTYDVVWNKDRDNVHYFTGRLGILFRPTETFENYTMAYGAKSDTNGAGNVHIRFNIPTLRAYQMCPDAACSTYVNADTIAAALGPRKTMGNVDAFQDTRTWGIENTSKLEIGSGLTLRNIVSYQKFKSSYQYDGDGTPLQQYDIGVGLLPSFPVTVSAGGTSIGPFVYANQSPKAPRDDFRTITEELQLQGTAADDKITYTVGGFLFDQKPKNNQVQYSILFCPPAFTGFCPYQSINNGVHSRSRALYAQGTIDLGLLSSALDRLRLTGGYRYTWDHITGFNISSSANANGTFNCGSPIVPGNPKNPDGTVNSPESCRFTGNLKTAAPSWTIGLDYKVTDRILAFTKVSRGYKSGGFNSYAVREETRTFVPERVLTYEVGFKSEFDIGIPARLNASYYHTKYANVQRAAGDFANGFSGAQILPAQAKVQGIEAEASVAPAPWFELGGNFSYTDAKYTRYVYTTAAATLSCDGTVKPFGGTVDATCLAFPFAPKYVFSIHGAINVAAPGNLGDLSLFVNLAHTSSQHGSPLPLPPLEPDELLPSSTLLSASLDLKNIAGSNVDAGLFATNLLNQTFPVSNTNGFDALLISSNLYSEPRMYGARLRFNF